MRSVLELTVACLFWGFGFIATIWTLSFISPIEINFYRFVVAAFVGFLLYTFNFFNKPQNTWKKFVATFRHEIWISLLPGFFLGAMILFQTWGLKTTTATNSSFITTLYVIIVPFFQWKTLNKKHWLCVFLALVGTAFIIDAQKMTTINTGDFLTLVCAFLAAAQILVVDKVSGRSKNPFLFNCFQSLWIALMTLPMFLFEDSYGHTFNHIAQLDYHFWIGMSSLSFGSSMIAFYFQIKAQQKLKASVASLIFLLEAPFAWIFSILILKEKITWTQSLGAVLITAACYLVVHIQRFKKA